LRTRCRLMALSALMLMLCRLNEWCTVCRAGWQRISSMVAGDVEESIVAAMGGGVEDASHSEGRGEVDTTASCIVESRLLLPLFDEVSSALNSTESSLADIGVVASTGSVRWGGDIQIFQIFPFLRYKIQLFATLPSHTITGGKRGKEGQRGHRR
jgi:hypothetical protein